MSVGVPPRHTRAYWLLAALSLVAASVSCGSDASGPGRGASQDDAGGQPDASDPISRFPDAPSRLRPQPEFLGSSEQLLTGETLAAVALSGNDVLAVGDGTVLRVDGRGDTESWEVALGEPIGLAAIAGERALIAGTGGLFAFDGDYVAESPLADALDGIAVESFLVVGEPPDEVLWLGASDGLYRWRDGRLEAIEVAGAELPTAHARLAWGAPLDDRPALWVAAAGVLWALVEADGALVAYPERDDLVIDGLGVDRIGQLWVVAGGDLHGRRPDGVWLWFTADEAFTALAGHPRSRDLWLASDSAVWHFRRGDASGDTVDEAISSRTPLLTRAAELEAHHLAVDATGRVTVSTTAGLYRVSLGRPFLVEGLEPGDQLLEEPVSVRLYPAREDRLQRLDAQLDQAPLTVTGPPFELTLDPTALGIGVHVLNVTATYTDGFEPVGVEVRFVVGEVPTPTWEADIGPLYQTECSECHGVGGTAHEMDTARAWEAEVVEILEAVRVERMPLAPNPPLLPDDIALIEDWVAGGFR